MTYGTFDLTEHTQLSIRGTTGTHPDSEYVFGVFIGTDELHAEKGGKTPDISAYDDMDWSKAVELAKWATETEFKKNDITEFPLTKHTVVACLTDYARDDFTFHIRIQIRGPLVFPRFVATDQVEWERALQMAKWILEWDEAFKKARE